MSSRKGWQIICKYAQCSGGIQLHMMRSAMRCRTWWFRTESPTRLWWKPVSQRQTEVPSMRMLSSLTPPPGRGSSWKYQSSQSGPTLHWGEARELDRVNAQLRAREDEKHNHSVVQKLLNEAGNNTFFTHIVMSACGAMGPSMVASKKSTAEPRKPISSSCRSSQH